MVNSLRNHVEEFTPLKKEDITGFRFKGNEKLKSNIYHDICELEYLYDSSFSTSPLTNIWPFSKYSIKIKNYIKKIFFFFFIFLLFLNFY